MAPEPKVGTKSPDTSDGTENGDGMRSLKAMTAPARLAAPLCLLLACSHAPDDEIHGGKSMEALRDPSSGQLVLKEGGGPVLQYNYWTVEPGEVLERVTEANLRYARPRSNYIHPLYGLDGEELTRDWSIDHPHHRGIYWAWPEVTVGEEMGDLHALQRVFARPTGVFDLRRSGDYAEIEAENRWLWEDREPIVREVALLRAYRSEGEERIVDLEFHFTALTAGVSVARRRTELYGGLNVRLAPVEDQEIEEHTDPPSEVPRLAWARLSGRFEGGRSTTAVSILQHPDNPDYPGDWVRYPELNWLQPTFPASGNRYGIEENETLVLRYRIWIHRGGADAERHAAKWREFSEAPPLKTP